jgi:hypothetical protein
VNKPPQRSTRPSQAGPPPRGSKAAIPSADVERALALRDVMEHAVKVQKEFKKPTPPPKPRAPFILASILCIPLLALCVYSWVAKPAFIWGPGARPIPPVRQEANVRFAMFLLTQRIESYRHMTGAYPTALISIGENPDGITYTLISDSIFQLHATENGKQIVYQTGDNADVFLGNSVPLIGGPGK